MKTVVSDKHKSTTSILRQQRIHRGPNPCLPVCVCVCQTDALTAYGQVVWVISMNAPGHYCAYLGLKFELICVRLIALPEKLIWVNVVQQSVCVSVSILFFSPTAYGQGAHVHVLVCLCVWTYKYRYGLIKMRSLLFPRGSASHL